MELAVIGGTEYPVQDLAVREELMTKRRKDQERHHSKQVWTKQPHGGPYEKVIIGCAAHVYTCICETVKS